MKFTKKFQSVNYINTVGDYYSKWSQGSKSPINAVSLSVTDDTGELVYFRCIQKGGFLARTLSDCKYMLNNNYRCWLETNGNK